MKNFQNDKYTINTETPKLKKNSPIEDDEPSIIEYLNSKENFPLITNREKVSLRKPKPQKIKSVSTKARIINRLKFNIDTLLIKKIIQRILCIIMVFGILAITLISAFFGTF